MNYKLIIYTFITLLCVFAVSSINFEKLILKNKIVEVRILVMIISLALSYLVTNFILDIMEYSRVI